MKSITTLRLEIDQVDHRLIRLLAKRMRLVGSIGVYKKLHNLVPLDPIRWQAVLIDRTDFGEKLGISSSLVKQIFEVIHEVSLRVEKGETL